MNPMAMIVFWGVGLWGFGERWQWRGSVSYLFVTALLLGGCHLFP